ncbi:MAG: ubiquitin-like small modifier protein 1 [Blastocatellia bacterium]
MSYKVYLSGHLKSFSNGQTEIGVSGNHKTVGDLLASLWRQHLSLRDRILTEQGDIRQHVNIFYQGQDIRRINGLQTHIDAGSELHIFNAVSGG